MEDRLANGGKMTNSNLKIKSINSKFYIQVVGSLDEDSNFSQIDLSFASEIFFDFKNITGIQSCGVREWLKLIKNIKNIPIYFNNCPKIIIDQINMVDGFLPKNAHVASFYVPYYSEATEEETHLLYEVKANQNQCLKLKEVHDSLGNPMELGVLEQRYFQFLKRHIKQACGFVAS
jgi:hypothetical protein